LEFTAIKGFKDILPDDVATWQALEAGTRRVFGAFGFREIRPPLMERTELFSRGIGQETDIVSKEMYTLKDSKGRGMTLRPEATASVARAYIQNRLYQKNPVQKLFTIGPMFRHERPQKGRFRQFHQINAEIFGDPGPQADAEIIVMAMTLLGQMGLTELTLNLNSLGCPDCRVAFRRELQSYLESRRDALCADCRRRSETNPLRVFDCKVETCREVVETAPSILDFICGPCRAHFETVKSYLNGVNTPYLINHKLVRGLDYYTRTTFEIQTEKLGAQNAVVGGGRYDGLVKLLGGPDHAGTGFAMGMERLVALLDESRKRPVPAPDLFMAVLGEDAEQKAFNWALDLRRQGFGVQLEYGSRGLKAQMKRAHRVGSPKVLIVGEEELRKGSGILRDMTTKQQQDIPLENLVNELTNILSDHE